MTTGRNVIALSSGATLALLACGAAPAQAQEISFTVAPYVWLAGINASATLNGHTVNGAASVGDLVKATETLFSFSGYGDVRYGPWSFFLEGVYSRMTDDPTLRNRWPLSVKIETSYLDFGIAYRFNVFEASQDSGWAMSLEPYVGGRYSATNISIRGQTAGIIDVNRSVSGVDPIFGGRLLLAHNDGWRFRVAGDVGGFGANSQLTWSASAMVGYRFELFGVWQTAWFGYKALGIDFESQRNRVQVNLNQVMHGPVLGLSFTF